MVMKTMVKMMVVVKTRMVMKRMVTRIYAYATTRMYSVMFLYALSYPFLKRLS